MNSELRDKEFMALELTKILFNDKCKYQAEQVFQTYTYFLNGLTDTLEETESTIFLKKQVEELQKKILEINSNNPDNREAEYLKRLREELETCKGDMEPYVYETLSNIIKNIG